LFLLVDNVTIEEYDLFEAEETQITTQSSKPAPVTFRNKEYSTMVVVKVN